MKGDMTITSADINVERVTGSNMLGRLWNLLDRLYLYCGYLAAFFLLCIFAVTMLQVCGRLVGYNPRGATDYAGYFMAASAFLAFAHTLNKGAHVRIELFLSLAGRYRSWAEIFSFVVSAIIAVWFSYHSWALVYWSYVLGDISQGLDATPVWIPQLSMAVGVNLLAIAVIDHGLRLIFTGDHEIETAAEAL
jgi:TRAP-type mannitol/chloroaromatic compound transport system permease small subunit